MTKRTSKGKDSAVDLEIERVIDEATKVRWWHFIPVVGVVMCSMEDVATLEKIKALSRKKGGAK